MKLITTEQMLSISGGKGAYKESAQFSSLVGAMGGGYAAYMLSPVNFGIPCALLGAVGGSAAGYVFGAVKYHALGLVVSATDALFKPAEIAEVTATEVVVA